MVSANTRPGQASGGCVARLGLAVEAQIEAQLRGSGGIVAVVLQAEIALHHEQAEGLEPPQKIEQLGA